MENKTKDHKSKAKNGKRTVGQEIKKKEKSEKVEVETRTAVVGKSEVMEPKLSINWEAHEFHYYKKDRWWLLGVAMLFGTIALSFVFVGSFPMGGLFSVVCVLLVVVLYQNSKEKPKKFLMELSEDGVIFRDKRYKYDQFKSFWVVTEPQAMLYLEQAKFDLPLTMLLEKQSPEEVRSFLLRYIPEQPVGGEHITDKVSRFLRL